MTTLLGNIDNVKTAADSPDIAVAGEVTVYTQSFKMNFTEYFGLWVKAVSASGTPTLKVELEQSYTLPATEGAADANWVEADGFSDVYANLNDEVAHVKSLSPVPMKYGRFKITGLTGNPADAILNIKLFMQQFA